MNAEAVAWTGIGIGTLILTIALLGAFYGLLKDPMGRAILIGWSLIGIGVWAALSVLYIIVQAV